MFLGYSSDMYIEARYVVDSRRRREFPLASDEADGQTAAMALRLNVCLMKKYTKLRTY